MIAWLAWRHWLVAVAFLPLLLVAALSPFRRRARRLLGRQAREAMGELDAFAVDTVQGLGEIVAFQQERARGATLAACRSATCAAPALLAELTRQQRMLEALVGLGGLVDRRGRRGARRRRARSTRPAAAADAAGMAAFLPVSEIAQVGRQLADTWVPRGASPRWRDEPMPGAPTAPAAASRAVGRGGAQR